LCSQGTNEVARSLKTGPHALVAGINIMVAGAKTTEAGELRTMM
jgi:hypothetical protein